MEKFTEQEKHELEKRIPDQSRTRIDRFVKPVGTVEIRIGRRGKRKKRISATNPGQSDSRKPNPVVKAICSVAFYIFAIAGLLGVPWLLEPGGVYPVFTYNESGQAYFSNKPSDATVMARNLVALALSTGAVALVLMYRKGFGPKLFFRILLFLTSLNIVYSLATWIHSQVFDEELWYNNFWEAHGGPVPLITATGIAIFFYRLLLKPIVRSR